jgi:type IV secretory pathway VirJ component
MENLKGRGSDLRRRRTTPRTSTVEVALPNTAPRRARARVEPDTQPPRPRSHGAAVARSANPEAEFSDTSLEKLIESRLLDRAAASGPPRETVVLQEGEVPARRRRANAPTSRIRGAVRALDPSAAGSGPVLRLPAPLDRSPAAALLPTLLPALAAALAVQPDPLPEIAAPRRGVRAIRWAVMLAAALAVLGAAAVLGFAV